MGILTDEKRKRFRELDRRSLEETLSAEKQAELDGFAAEIEAAETAYLQPALERLRAENDETRSRIAALEELAKREAFHRRMKSLLNEASAERRALREQYEQIMSGYVPDGKAGAV